MTIEIVVYKRDKRDNNRSIYKRFEKLSVECKKSLKGKLGGGQYEEQEAASEMVGQPE